MVDLIFLCVVIAATCFTTLAVIVRAKLRSEAADELRRTWDSYAKTRGLAQKSAVPPSKQGTKPPVWRAPPSFGTPHVPPELEGASSEDERVRLQALGTEGVRITKMEVRVDEAFCARLVCTTLKKGLKGPRTSVSPLFDPIFATAASPEAFARNTLSLEIQRRILAFAMGGHLRFAYERGWLSLQWPGHEQNDARLDEALSLLQRAAETLRSVYAGDFAVPRREPGRGSKEAHLPWIS